MVGADVNQASVVFRHDGVASCSAVAWPAAGSERGVVLGLGGTWCTDTVARASAVLFGWITAADAIVVVDLSGIEFCDARAITMLLEMRHAAERRGGVMRLCRPSRCVRRLFEICDLAALSEADVAQSLPALHGRTAEAG